MDANGGHLYLGAEMTEAAEIDQSESLPNADPKNTLPKVGGFDQLASHEAKVEQAVVVRFLVRDNEGAQSGAPDQTTAAANLQAAVASISLQNDTSGNTVSARSQLGTQTGVAFYEWDSSAEQIKSVDFDLDWLFIGEGVSVNQGGGGGPADSSMFFPIVFYDWDGVTMLGSTIVAKSDDDTEQAQLINTAMENFTKTLMPPDLDGDGNIIFEDDKKTVPKSTVFENIKAEMIAWQADNTKIPKDYYNPSYILTSKKSYTFGKWIDFDNPLDINGKEAFTSYGKAVDVGARGSVIDIAEPKNHIYSKADQSGFAVKAAYCGNIKLKDLTTGPSRDYTVTLDSYLQFGLTANVQIKLTVRRENTAGVGVHRVRNLGLRVSYNVGEDVFSLVNLDNKDEVSVILAASGRLDHMSIEVIDTCSNAEVGGLVDWSAAVANRSDPLIKDAKKNKAGELGFVELGVVGYINDEVAKAFLAGEKSATIRDDLSDLTASKLDSDQFDKAGFDYSAVANANSLAPWDLLAGAVANIFDAYSSLNPKRELTWAEMQKAITDGQL